jgi:hypothetical protein
VMHPWWIVQPVAKPASKNKFLLLAFVCQGAVGMRLTLSLARKRILLAMPVLPVHRLVLEAARPVNLAKRMLKQPIF